MRPGWRTAAGVCFGTLEARTAVTLQAGKRLVYSAKPWHAPDRSIAGTRRKMRQA